MSSTQSVRVLLLQDLTTSSNWGGVQTMTLTLQLALQERGFLVTALPWQQTKFGKLLAAARDCDVLVASHNFGPTYSGVALKTLTRKPLISWVHGPLLNVLQMSKAGSWKRLWLKHVYSNVDRFVCVSQTTEVSLLGFLSTIPTVVIPNGLTPLAKDSGSFVFDEYAAQKNLSSGYVGRLSEEKRPHLLIETLRVLPAGTSLCIVGDGELRPALESAGKDLITNGRLRFLGHQASGQNLYKPYQVTLLTSQFEGFGMAALESLACGVPCVTLPIPAMRELFAHDAPYLLAHDETPEALAIALMNLVHIPIEQIHADMARILSKYALSRFAKSWQTTLEDLLISSARKV